MGSITIIGGNGYDVSDTNAISSDVLKDKKFYNNSGELKTGTIETVSGSTNYIPSSSNITISGGKYYSDSLTIPVDTNSYNGWSYASDKTVFGITGLAKRVIFVNKTITLGSAITLQDVEGTSRTVRPFTLDLSTELTNLGLTSLVSSSIYAIVHNYSASTYKSTAIILPSTNNYTQSIMNDQKASSTWNTYVIDTEGTRQEIGSTYIKGVVPSNMTTSSKIIFYGCGI